MPATVSKTFRIPTPLQRRLRVRAGAERKQYAQAHREALERGLAQSEGIDMATALNDFIGLRDGTGRTQAERMKRYGRFRIRSSVTRSLKRTPPRILLAQSDDRRLAPR